MPDETPPAASSSSLRAQFESLILDPYRLLVIGAYVIAAGGLLLAITDVAAWADNGTEAFEFFLLDIFFTVAALSIVVGIIAVIHGVRQRNGATPPDAPKDLVQGLTNPVWLLNIAPDAVLAAGGANLLFYLIDSYDIGAVDVIGGVFDILFRVSFAFFMVLTLKFISDWLHGTERVAPPVAEGAAPTWKDRYWQLVRNPDQFLFFGLLLTVYLSLLEAIFEIWGRWDGDVADLWLEFIGHMAEAATAAAFLIVARSIVNWLRGAGVPGGGLARAVGEDLPAWAQRLTANPRLAIDAALILAVVGGVPFYMADFWGARNFDVDNFWILVLENSLFGLSIIGSLLVLRAFGLYMLNGGTGSYRERLSGASEAVFYNNPAWLLQALVYAIATGGLVYISLTTWDWRGQGFWVVWYFFFLLGGEMVVPLAIFLGGRALYAEALAEREPVVMTSAGGHLSQPVTADVVASTSDSGTVT